MTSRIVLAAALALGACTDDHSVVEIGVTESGPDQAAITVPVTATVNTPLTIQLSTLGDGCVSFERTDVEVTADRADITPYDRREVGGNCIEPLLLFPHDVMLEFSTPGDKQIVITGRKHHFELGKAIEELVTYPYVVTVQ